jgi:hypothetical protein
MTDRLLEEIGNERRSAPSLELRSHVDDMNPGKRAFQYSRIERKVSDVLFSSRIVERLQLWRGSSQHDHCPLNLSPLQSCVSPIVSGKIVLFVGSIVLFVDDD